MKKQDFLQRMIRQLRGLRSDDVLCSRPARSHPAHDLTDDLFYVFEKNKRFCDRRERNRSFFSEKSSKCFEKRIEISLKILLQGETESSSVASSHENSPSELSSSEKPYAQISFFKRFRTNF